MVVMEFRGAIDRPTYARALRLAGLAPRTLGVLLLLAGVYGLLTYSKFSDPASWGIPLFVALLGTYLLLSPFIVARRALRTSSIVGAPFTGSADESAFVLESAHGRANIAWSEFHRAIVSPQLVLLFISAQQFHIMSRAFFASETEWSQFRELVSAKVPAKHGKRSVMMVVLLWLAIVVGTFVIWSVSSAR